MIFCPLCSDIVIDENILKQVLKMLTHGGFAVLRLLCTISSTAVLVVFLILLLVHTYCQQESQNRRNTAERFFHETVSLFLGDWIQFSSSNKTYYLKIDGVHTTQCPTLPHGVVIALFTYTLILVMFAIVIFWELFICTISSTCKSDSWGFCFPTGNNSAERILECTVKESDVICYWFSFEPWVPAGIISTLYLVIRSCIKLVNKRVIKYYWKDKKKIALCFPVLLFMAILLVVICVVGAISRRRKGNPFLRKLVFIFPYLSLLFTVLVCLVPLIIVLKI